ncbi:MAG: thioredoxin family protein [Chitinophagales bacterium]
MNSNAAFAKGIEFFQGTWDEASTLARHLQRPLFVEAYSDTCGLCMQMEESVFSQEEVGSFYNNHFVNLKINVDKAEGHSFSKKYKVQVLPDLIFLHPMGYPIYRDLGDKDKVQLLTLAYKALKSPLISPKTTQLIESIQPFIPSKTMLETMNEQYAKGFQSPSFLHDYAYELRKHNEPYVEVVNTYLSHLKKNKLKSPKNILFVYDFSNNLQTDAMSILLRMRTTFEGQFGYAHIVNRIKSTALSNASIAAKDKNEKLFKETKQMLKKAKFWDEDRMVFLVESIYYKESADWRNYIYIVKEYIEKHGVRHPDFLHETAEDLMNYSEEVEDLELAKKWMETAIVQTQTYAYYNTYAHIMFKLGYLINAKTIAYKALEYSAPENKEGLSAKLLIDQIQNYITNTTTPFNRPIKL